MWRFTPKKTLLTLSIILLVFLSASIAFAGNPVTPILPSDNIQDPGSPLTSWGGCTPSDSNCYVTVIGGYTDEQAQDAVGNILSNEFTYNDGAPSISINSINVSKLSGVLPVASGGTGLGSLGTANQLIRVNGGATALEYFTPTYITGNENITLSGDISGSGTTAITTTIGTGKVTNSMLAGSIAYNKLSLTGAILNGDLAGSIASSKLVGSDIATVGTITSGVWNGSAIADAYVASASVWNAKENALTFSTGLTRSVNTITVNTTQNIAKLSNLTSNGFVKTSGGDGTLSVDTTTYLSSEADTLATVTGRGATTSTASSFTGGATIRGATIDTATATDDLFAISITPGGGARFTGTLTNADLSGNKTYTFPNATGTVITTGNITDITGLTDSQISDTLTSSIFIGSGSTTNAVDLATAEVAGTLGVGNGGTGTNTSFTQGSIVFSGASGVYNQDNTKFFYDSTNHFLGLGTASPVDVLSIGTAPTASATHALLNLSNTALSSGSANGTYLGANPGSFTGDFIDLQIANTKKFKVDASGVITSAALTSGGTQCLQASSSGVISGTGLTCGSGSGGISSLILAGTLGTPQTLTDGDTITIAAGNGISTTAGATDTLTVDLAPLTADWNQTGAFNISLNNSSAGLKILENGSTPTLFGIFDVADLSSSDKTYTFPNATGTVITTGNITDITGLTDSQISDTLTSSIFIGSGSTTNAVDLATAEVAGKLSFANITQIAGLSILGVTGASTADVAAITGTADQVLRVNSAGTALGFGTISNAGLTNSSITVSSGTSGSDFNISGSPVSLGGTLTLNIPDASASNRGLVTTGTQTFAGAKTFSNSTGITFSNSETIDNATNSTFTFGRNDAGTVILTAKDDNSLADLTIQPGSTGELDLISSNASGTAIRIIANDGAGSVEIGGGSGYSSTSLAKTAVVLGGNTYTAASGAGTMTSLSVLGTYNLTGTANGIQTGITISPTLTSLTAATYRGINIPYSNSSAYGIYQSGASTLNYFNGNTGFGDTSPASLLTVGNGDLFQVNSSGAIAAAAGITSSGTITFSGFSTNGGLLYTNGSGVLAQTGAGTSTTILHGGTTPSYSAVSLTADVSGDLPFSNLAQIAGLSILGVTGASTADVAAITGTADQVLRVNSAGTALGFGTISNAGLTNSSITVSSGTSGSDFNISGSPVSLGGTLTLNIPDASASNRGLVTTGTQTFAGAKTFSTSIANGGNYTQTAGVMSLTSANDTQTTTSSVFALNGNSLTTGTGLYIGSSSLTSGSLIDLSVTGPGATNQKGINVSLSNGSLSGGYTTYGIYTSNSQANAGNTNTDVGLFATAFNGRFNYAGVFDQGNVGIGDTTPTEGKLTLVDNVNTVPTFYLANNTATTLGAGANTNGIVDIQSTSLTTGNLINVEGNALTSGTALNVSSTSANAITGQKGINVALTGALTGAQTTYGGYLSNTRTGASAVNVGIYSTASGATGANYAAIFDQGNVGIGDTTPLSLLTVGSGDLFQVNSSGAIAAAAGITSSGTITFSGLGGGGTQCVQTSNTGVLSAAACGGSATLNGLTAATGTNTINNANYAQEWQWNTLAGTTGLKLSSTSTAAASNAQKLFEISTSGTNSTSAQTTYGAYISNTHAGTTSTNVGLYATATGGTTANYAIQTVGTIRQDSVNGVAGFLQTNGTNLLSTTLINPGIDVFHDNANMFGFNLGYTGSTSRYSLQNFFSDLGDYVVASFANGALPTAQSDFTPRLTIRGDSGNVGIGLSAPTGRLQIAAGTTTAGTAPLKFTSGSLNTTAEAGAMEFLTDNYYGTITTGAARKEFTLNDSSLTSGRVPFATTNGRLTDNSSFSYATTNGGRLTTTGLTLTPSAVSGGTIPLAIFTGAAHINQAASTENSDVQFNLNRTLNFSTGAITTQRAVLIQAPSYSFGGASTITDAATVAITGAPKSQTNATITNTHALLVQAGAVQPAGTVTNSYGLTVNAQTGASNNYTAAFLGGNVGIGDSSPASLLTVGSGDLFQVNSSGAIAAVVGITNTGAQSTTVSSTTALTVANTGTNYGFQVDTSTGSSATGIKIKSAAAAGGVALSAISSGTDENLSIDAKGAGSVSIAGTSTGDISMAGGYGLGLGCTVTNSTGALACSGSVMSANTLLAGSGNQFQATSGGNVILTSANTTQTTTSSIFSLAGNSLTSGTGLYAASSSLTSGSLASIVSSSTGITSAGSNVGSLLDITSSQPISSFTGSLVSINASGNSTSGATGNALAINLGATGQLMKGINFTDATTGNMGTSAGTSGGVVFSMTGAHTGYGFQVSDATATGTAMAINANSLSSGTGLYMLSSSLSSGTLMDLNVTGANAASNTQKVLNIATSGGNSNSTQTTYGSYISNTHTGTSSTNVGGYFTASGGSNNYAGIFDSGRVLVGLTSESVSASKIYVQATNSDASGGATAAIAGIHENLTFSPSGGGTQIGNRLVLNESPTSTANTMVGQIVRTVDNTTLANTVRGIEVLSSAGSNTAGTNTGIRSTGATFGIQAITTGLAGGVLAPAALYGENTGDTQGDALRLFTSTMTSAPQMAYFYHDTSTFTGTGLLMDFATGSGTFSGNFVDFQNNNVSKFTVTSAGVVSMGLSGTASTNAVCSSLANTTAPTAGTAYEIRDCNAAPAADYAEMYPVESGVEYGDIVTTSTDMVDTYDTTDGNVNWTKVKGKVSRLVKSNESYQENVVGIVSDNYGDFTSAGHNIKDHDNPMPIALNGRVPVKIASTSDPIAPGDYLTTSIEPGKATKATGSGQVIGKALEAWTPGVGLPTIMVFVEQGYHNDKSINMQDLGIRIKNIEELVDTDSGSFVGHLRTWLASMSNGITTIFANTFEGNTVRGKDQVCVGDTCINESQLKALILQAGQNGSLPNNQNSGGGSGGGSSTPPSDGGSTPPVDNNPPPTPPQDIPPTTPTPESPQSDTTPPPADTPAPDAPTQ